MSKSVVYMIAGEHPPFLRKSEACYKRLGAAVVKYGLKPTSCLQFEDSFVMALELPADKIKEVEQDLKCTLIWHPDIRIGMKTQNSLKWKDENGAKYASEYPSKELPLP